MQTELVRVARPRSTICMPLESILSQKTNAIRQINPSDEAKCLRMSTCQLVKTHIYW